ncbi:MAG TPA: RES superfamily protein [Chitinophagaceae bacterium]|nr:RES superfamily protein [Chitinophagaceae bacterium]HCT23383.1 RES superfamily protein [Chitinophagaceae bacterium]
MEAYRLSRKMYASTLSGKGAALKGARWNSIGVEMIYTASNRSLAMAEVAVHLSLATLPTDYMMVTLFIPDDISIQKLTVADLPTDWNTFPHPISTQAIGDKFIAANQHCILQIPSSVTQGDYNLLINPNHPDFSRIKIITVEPFPFDKRIFK